MDSDSSHGIEVTVEAEAWRTTVTDPEHLCRRAVAAVLAREAVTADVEVSVLLANDRRIRELNLAYRGKDSATNVLSFPAGEDGVAASAPGTARPVLLGDIAVALETTVREAAAAGKPAADHLVHLLVHGALHLLGHDHEEDEQAERMEAREVELLASLGVADPYRAEAVP
ncbi:MAG TPA: rRNA maturation RNase YbeY [Geminicoccaceae bacterium]|nr:rRNA maturation RNase YbeY [Geminicoccaceae bacterium]